MLQYEENPVPDGDTETPDKPEDEVPEQEPGGDADGETLSFTKAELEAHINELVTKRLARDRKSKSVRALEAKLGVDLDTLVAQLDKGLTGQAAIDAAKQSAPAKPESLLDSPVMRRVATYAVIAELKEAGHDEAALLAVKQQALELAEDTGLELDAAFRLALADYYPKRAEELAKAKAASAAAEARKQAKHGVVDTQKGPAQKPGPQPSPAELAVLRKMFPAKSDAELAEIYARHM